MGAGPSLIGYPAVSAYEVQAFGGGSIGLVDGVVYLLNEDGQGDVQVQAAGVGYFLSILEALVLPERMPSATLLSVCHPSVGWAS